MTNLEYTGEVSYLRRLIGMFSRKRSSGVVALPSKTAVGIFSHRAEPSNLFGENGRPRNFQTGSEENLGTIIQVIDDQIEVTVIVEVKGG
jgi:hypothetical protein